MSQVRDILLNANTHALAAMHGLVVQTVAWDDTGRWANSALGPNISDMTLVTSENMPIIRAPNFTDKTCDMPLSSFVLKVGNETGIPLQDISLKNYLENYGHYSGNTKTQSLLADRDLDGAAVLVSAQACILPASELFNVQLYNYQSVNEAPAVLVILASANGTSSQIVSEQNQKLYYNNNGQRARFKAQRLEDRRKESGQHTKGPLKSVDMTDAESFNNALYVIQVPLKRTTQPDLPDCLYRRIIDKARTGLGPLGLGLPLWAAQYDDESDDVWLGLGAGYGPLTYTKLGAYIDDELLLSDEESIGESIGEEDVIDTIQGLEGLETRKVPKTGRGMDMAHITVGQDEGPFPSKSVTLVRDANLPIRVTIQAYRATDTNHITQECMQDIADQLNRYYKRSAASGSLVVDPDMSRKTNMGERKTTMV